jgi:hypothetical protein
MELDVPSVEAAKIPMGDVPVGPPPVGSEQSLSAVRVLMPTTMQSVSNIVHHT